MVKTMRYATDSALQEADCRICDQTVIAVDGAFDRDGNPKGGQWVHVALPPSIHPAMPGKERRSPC